MNEKSTIKANEQLGYPKTASTTCLLTSNMYGVSIFNNFNLFRLSFFHYFTTDFWHHYFYHLSAILDSVCLSQNEQSVIPNKKFFPGKGRNMVKWVLLGLKLTYEPPHHQLSRTMFNTSVQKMEKKLINSIPSIFCLHQNLDKWLIRHWKPSPVNEISQGGRLEGGGVVCFEISDLTSQKNLSVEMQTNI